MSFNYSADEKHRESLGILRDTIACLRRLSFNAVNHDLCNRTQAHLDQPTHRSLNSETRIRTGSACTAVGLEWLHVSLQDSVVTVQVPDQPAKLGVSESDLDRLVMVALRTGVEIPVGDPGCLDKK
jgi:hypothetical protein